MKKLLTALLLACSLTAQAENWQMLTETKAGTRLLVDYDSIDIEEYKVDARTKSFMTRATMMLADSDKTFAVAIDAKECLAKNSGFIAFYYSGQTKTQFWTSEGDRLYDAQGIFLCHVTKKLIEKIKQQPNKVPV